MVSWTMSNEVFIALDLSEGQRIRLTRLAKNLRQVDVASLARVTVSDVVNIEKDRFLPMVRRDKILDVLGLNNNGTENKNG